MSIDKNINTPSFFIILMKEGRAAKYGRFYAALVDYTIQTIPEPKREGYRSRLVQELERFSFKPRRKGEPINEGCRWELEDMVECDIENPEHLGRLIKEGVHLMYVKDTARKVLGMLIEHLE